MIEETISASRGSRLSWFLIHTKPRQEALALANLIRQGFDCYMPLLKLERIRQRKVIVVDEPMFARYLFIRLDASGLGQSWAPIRSTIGVTQLVRFGGHPAKVNDQLIAQLQIRDQTSSPEILFEQGAGVVIKEGPFAGIEAIYQSHDAHSRSVILLEILSKLVAIRVETANLRGSKGVG